MKPPLEEYRAERIAIIKPSALGDIVHALPVLTALRQRFPAAHLAWIVNKSYEPLLAGHPDLNETIAFDRKAAQRGMRSMVLYNLRFLQELRQRRFDLVIDLQGLFRAAVMTWASGARRRVGLSTAREGAVRAYTDVVPVADFFAIHAVDRYWLVAQALGIKQKEIRFNLPVVPAALEWAREQLMPLPRPWLMLTVGSRWQTKRWPVEHFAALTREAQSRFGGTAVFLGGGDETALAQQTAAGLTGPTLDLTGRTTLPQLSAVLSLADLLVSNDTGPLHLAVALGRPIVSPYTCTRALLTGPYGRQRSVVETKVWCAGSLVKQCSRMECMTELTPAKLWPLVEEELSAWQTAQRCA
jgi:lipopolysaccharide heptosyltransferase I